MKPSWRMANLRRRVNRARNFPENTCSCSRHLHIIADNLMRDGKDYLVETEPDHCAQSIYVVLEDLWKLRTELAKLKETQ